MEAVGGIASIIQILDATAKLINYVKDVRGAEKQVTAVQAEIEVIRYVLNALKVSVDGDPETFRVTSTILGANDGILDELFSFALSFKEKLEAKPGRKLLWPFNKYYIQQDLEKIQGYKTVLVCALLNDSMSVCHFFFRRATLQVTTFALFNFSRWNHTIIKPVTDTKIYLDYYWRRLMTRLTSSNTASKGLHTASKRLHEALKRSRTMLVTYQQHSDKKKSMLFSSGYLYPHSLTLPGNKQFLRLNGPRILEDG